MQEVGTQNMFGFAHLWENGDLVSHTVAIGLALMSIASWYLILAKAVENWKLRKAARSVSQFWSAICVIDGIQQLREAGGESPYVQLATQASCCNSDCEAASGHLASRFDPAEQMERALRQQLSCTQAGMESGLTLLATTGATAPFVGLFGTVWGIYHALTAIGIAGQASIDKVAGPVGEALIMTAIGLAVAVPAVLGYNWLVRRNKVTLDQVRGFAADLHGVLMGAKASR